MKNNIKFICVGVQKAGTSTLHDILIQHPNLKLPTLKETHHFRDVEKFNKGKDHYFNYYFKKRDKQKYYGEINPEYAYFDECGDRIKSYFDELKIVFILRNPVDRAYSHYLMTKRRGLETLSFEDAITHEKDRLTSHYNKIHYSYISRGYYSKQISRFENLFGSNNVKIVLFDNLVKDSKITVDEIVDFIGLNKMEFNYDVKSNPATKVRNKHLRDFIYQENTFKKIIGKLIPSKKIKDYIMNTLSKKNLKPSETIKLEMELKKFIYQRYFVDEIGMLEKKLGINLSNWKY
jgi:hypothetical protein